MSQKRKTSLPYILLSLCILLFLDSSTLAETSQKALSGTTLYKTCLDEPEHEQCQGIAVSKNSINDKLGTKAICEKKSCKIEIKPDRLILYIKRGGELTQEISIPFNRIILADLQFWRHFSLHNTLYIPSPKEYQKFIDDFNL